MKYSDALWPEKSRHFWDIKNENYKIEIKWSHKPYVDYKCLAYQFFECGYYTFKEVIESGHDNIKSDMWFLTGIFLCRQSIELALKALLCRVFSNNRDIQNVFLECCHDVAMLFEKYHNIEGDTHLSPEERCWLKTYLDSLEEIDSKSDMFRFPFEDEFLSKYRNKFLDNVDVANNIVQAFYLVKKCLENGNVLEDEKFEPSYQPSFFIFASHGIGNCYLWQSISDKGFHVKVTGYNEVIDYIYKSELISNENKFYPMMFMCRNTIELCLKRLFYSSVDDGVPMKIFYAKRKSHLIKKELWKYVKPVIERYAYESSNDTDIINIVEKMIVEISQIDKNGDMFRYPTSYSLEYRFDNYCVDISNVYEYSKGIINFLDGCDAMLDAIADYQNEMRVEYMSDY